MELKYNPFYFLMNIAGVAVIKVVQQDCRLYGVVQNEPPPFIGKL